MTMKNYSEKEMKELKSAFEKRVFSWPNITHKKTFGCPSYQTNGKTFAILVTKGILISKIDQAIKDSPSDQNQDSAIPTGKRNIEHWVRLPMKDEAEMDNIMPIVKRSSEIVQQEE
ncbi:MAG: hypothetical protein M8349_09100 [ANME-2 cluster archaeon]|nr:hypothetical protein [ANME-2 cluster archaeon]MDF1557833.1 hypothetical protein [ANME-2 cluster archaeon]